MKAAIRVGPLMFTGMSHAEALSHVLISCIPTSAKREALKAFQSKSKDTGFMDDQGKFITRAEAKARYGFSTSEEMGV